MMQKIYFDNAATTAIAPEVIDVMTAQLSNVYGNPSSTHYHGREAKGHLEAARRLVAECINAKPSQIVFTSCGTESNNMVLKNSIKNLNIQLIISTPIEHPSVFKTLKDLSDTVSIAYLDVDAHGHIRLEQLEQMLIDNADKQILVSIMHANNEIGTLNPIEDIVKISKQYGALVHSDMVQTIGHIDIDVEKLGIDFLSASAHKFHGPKGAGFLYNRIPNQLGQFISGGSQERGSRSGTENLPCIVGMATALQIALKNLDHDRQYIENIRMTLANKIKTTFPDIDIITPLDKSLYTVLTLGFPQNMSHEMLPFQLDLKGISCSSGSACSSGAQSTSHVVQAIGYDQNRKVIRFSFSKYNHIDEVDLVIKLLLELKNEILSAKNS